MKYKVIYILFILIGCETDSIEKHNQRYLISISFFKDEFVDHFPNTVYESKIPFQYNSIISNRFECVSIEYHATYDVQKVEQLIDSLSNIALKIYNSADTCLLVVNRFHNEFNIYDKKIITENEKLDINLDCYNKKLPIQNFYGSMYANYATECNLPTDFDVYVLDAQKGIYWDEKYLYGGRYMPGEWEHGYSKGIAISKKRSVVIYWFVIW